MPGWEAWPPYCCSWIVRKLSKNLVDLGFESLPLSSRVGGCRHQPGLSEPIFNKVTRLDDPRITAPILRMAHANGFQQ